MTGTDHVLRALRGPLSSADREQLALGIVYEATRALEALTELRQCFDATAVAVDGELPQLERALAKTMSALSQLSDPDEGLEAAAERVADTVAR